MENSFTVSDADRVAIPVSLIPTFRTRLAYQRGANQSLLFETWGGIGDVICSEPTVRFSLENFHDCKITVATSHPEVFRHLALHDVYDLNKERPIYDDYLLLRTIPMQSNGDLAAQFISHMITNCVDFPALSALRRQLHIQDRNVVMRPAEPKDPVLLDLVKDSSRYVVIHAGRHWESKTFPVDWWNQVLTSVVKEGLTPILIGKHEGETQGYVDVDPEGCVDLRDKTSLNDCIWLVQNMPVLVCNDSSPLHMAASGRAWILFVASVKHPDFITHWRRPPGADYNVWSWRMKDLSVSGVWSYEPACPNKTEDLVVDKLSEDVIRTFLPDPTIFGPLCKEKIDDYFR